MYAFFFVYCGIIKKYQIQIHFWKGFSVMADALFHSFDIDTERLNNYKKLQVKKNFLNCTNEIYAPLDSCPDSAIRFWINDKLEEYPFHKHPSLEIVMPLSSDYTVYVNQTCFHLTAGEILLIPSMAPHYLVPTARDLSGQRLIYQINCDPLSRINGFSYVKELLKQPVLINRTSCPDIYDTEVQIMLQVLNEYFCDGHLQELVIFSSLLNFFSTYARCAPPAALPSEAENMPASNTLFNRFNYAMDYINKYCTEDITLDMVADYAGLSKYHFSRLFKQYSGLNYYDYLCACRIKKVEHLLSRSELSITDVAFQTGFSSISTFNRIFKKVEQCTPTEYRNLLHEPE